MKYPWVYGIKSGDFIKIGATADIENRLKQFQLGNPHKMTVALRQMCDEAFWLEMRMHQILKPFKYRREWFEIDVRTAKSALSTALDNLAEKRMKQIAWQIKTGDCEYAHSLAKWNGRGIAPEHFITL